MGGGEYNNLGHYVYLKNEDGTYEEVGEVPKIPVMPEFTTGGVVDNSEISFVEQSGFEMEFKGIINIKALGVLGLFVVSNNYRKMHGLPMRRKVRR